jgi:hypothetical protein
MRNGVRLVLRAGFSFPMILLVLGAGPLHAAQWYAAPNAVLNGNGSSTNPWPLQLAFKQTTKIRPGDTLYLRGGIYQGSGFFSTLSGASNSYVTVRSYPGEWAVLEDGVFGVLDTVLSATDPSPTMMVIRNSETWQPAQVVTIDNENLQLSGAYTTPTNWNANRGWNGTIQTNHAKGTIVYPYGASILQHSGSYVIFRDFEITSLMTMQRMATVSYFPGGGLNLQGGVGNKAVDLIIHDTGHPGIGFWSQGAGGELNGCIVWGSGIYDYTPAFNYSGEPRGCGVYSQNVGGLAKIRNCIFFSQFTTGAKVFGETGPVRDFVFDGNIAFGNAIDPLEILSGSTPTSNTWMQSNFMLGTPKLHYVSVSNSTEYFINNTVVNGTFTTGDYLASVYTNNLVLMPANSTNDGSSPVQYLSSLVAKSNLASVVWDYNTYYLGANSSLYQWGFRTSDVLPANAAGGGNLRFSNDNGKAWVDWSGFDVHSTCQAGWPALLRIQVMPLDYDTNTSFVCVVSTSTQTNALLDLSRYGFAAYDRYELRDAQNYFTVIGQGVYNGGTINLPLNLTNIVSLRGTVTNFVSQHTNVKNPGLFNAFVLRRAAVALSPASDLHVMDK